MKMKKTMEKKKLLKEEKQTKKGEKRLPKIVTNMRHAACLPTNECLSGFEYVLKWQNIQMFEWNEGRIQG